jgi:hypothetical protein
MDPRELETLRKAYNKEHPYEKPIKKGDIWKEITLRLKKACKASTPECIVRNLVDNDGLEAVAAAVACGEEGAEDSDDFMCRASSA